MVDATYSIVVNTNNAEQRLRNLAAQFQRLGRSSTGATTGLSGLMRNLSITTTAANQAASQLMNAGQSANTAGQNFQSSSRNANQLTQGLQGLSRVGRIAAGVLGAIGVAGGAVTFRNAVIEARQFSRALAEVETLNQNLNISRVQDAIDRFANSFGTTRTLQAQGFYSAVSAGATDAASAIQLMNAANRLAIGGVTDVQTAVNGLTTILNSYGLAASQAADISNALFIAVRAGRTTIPELSAVIGRAAPLASALGVSFEELLASTAALTTTGVSTAEALTGVRAIMASILRPTAEARAEAERLGIQYNITGLRTRGLQGFLEELIRVTGGSQSTIATFTGSLEATTAAIALTGAAGESFNSIIDQMNERAGTTTAAFDTVADSLDFRATQALQRWENAVSGLALPVLDGLIVGIDTVISATTTWTVAATALAHITLPTLITALGTVIGSFTSIASAAFQFAQGEPEGIFRRIRFETRAAGGGLRAFGQAISFVTLDFRDLFFDLLPRAVRNATGFGGAFAAIGSTIANNWRRALAAIRRFGISGGVLAGILSFLVGSVRVLGSLLLRLARNPIFVATAALVQVYISLNERVERQNAATETLTAAQTVLNEALTQYSIILESGTGALQEQEQVTRSSAEAALIAARAVIAQTDAEIERFNTLRRTSLLGNQVLGSSVGDPNEARALDRRATALAEIARIENIIQNLDSNRRLRDQRVETNRLTNEDAERAMTIANLRAAIIAETEATRLSTERRQQLAAGERAVAELKREVADATLEEIASIRSLGIAEAARQQAIALGIRLDEQRRLQRERNEQAQRQTIVGLREEVELNNTLANIYRTEGSEAAEIYRLNQELTNTAISRGIDVTMGLGLSYEDLAASVVRSRRNLEDARTAIPDDFDDAINAVNDFAIENVRASVMVEEAWANTARFISNEFSDALSRIFGDSGLGRLGESLATDVLTRAFGGNSPGELVFSTLFGSASGNLLNTVAGAGTGNQVASSAGGFFSGIGGRIATGLSSLSASLTAGASSITSAFSAIDVAVGASAPAITATSAPFIPGASSAAPAGFAGSAAIPVSLVAGPFLGFLAAAVASSLFGGGRSSGPGFDSIFAPNAQGGIGRTGLGVNNRFPIEDATQISDLVINTTNSVLGNAGLSVGQGAFRGAFTFDRGRFRSSAAFPNNPSTTRGRQLNPESLGLEGVSDSRAFNNLGPAIVDFVSRNTLLALREGRIEGLSAQATEIFDAGLVGIAENIVNQTREEAETALETFTSDFAFINRLAEATERLGLTAEDAGSRVESLAATNRGFSESLEALRAQGEANALESGFGPQTSQIITNAQRIFGPAGSAGEQIISNAADVAIAETERFFRSLTTMLQESVNAPLQIFEEVTPVISPIVAQFQDLRGIIDSTRPGLGELNASLVDIGATAIDVDSMIRGATDALRQTTQDTFLASLGIAIDPRTGQLADANVDFGSISRLRNDIRALDANAAELFREDPRNLLPQLNQRINSLLEAGANEILANAEDFSTTLAQLNEIFGTRLNGLSLTGNVGNIIAPQFTIDDIVSLARDQLGIHRDMLRIAERSVELFENIEEDLRDTLLSNQLASFSPLSPIDRLARAQEEFNRIRDNIGSTDDEVQMMALSQLGDASTVLLREAQSFWASGPEYVSIWETTNSVLRQGIDISVDERTMAQMQVDRLTDLVRINQEILQAVQGDDLSRFGNNTELNTLLALGSGFEGRFGQGRFNDFIESQRGRFQNQLGVQEDRSLFLGVSTGFLQQGGRFGQGRFQEFLRNDPLAQAIFTLGERQGRFPAPTAFQSGGIFTNSIVSSPMVAPQALFGERGPEAIVPLVRGPDGNLGIRSTGSNNSAQFARIEALLNRLIAIEERKGLDNRESVRVLVDTLTNIENNTQQPRR